jgi:hypothetical protein
MPPAYRYKGAFYHPIHAADIYAIAALRSEHPTTTEQAELYLDAAARFRGIDRSDLESYTEKDFPYPTTEYATSTRCEYCHRPLSKGEENE